MNDWEYFLTLLRYIHQNPVAGGLVGKVIDYAWSSWGEYVNLNACSMPFCSTSTVFSRITKDALEELVYEPLAKTRRILDYDNETSIRLSDEIVHEFICVDCAVCNPKDIQFYSQKERYAILKKIRDFGGSIRQISRITGISENIVRKVR